MNLFFWRSFKPHDEFVNGIVDEFIKSYPPEISHERPDKKVEKKFNKTLRKIFSDANEYGSKYKPGIYGKARIGNKFMWTLKDKGYDPVLVENITQDLLSALSRRDSEK